MGTLQFEIKVCEQWGSKQCPQAAMMVMVMVTMMMMTIVIVIIVIIPC